MPRADLDLPATLDVWRAQIIAAGLRMAADAVPVLDDATARRVATIDAEPDLAKRARAMLDFARESRWQ